MRNVLLVLHIIGLGSWLGANVVQILSTRRLVANGGDTAAAWTDTTLLWGRILYMPAAILLLITGTWLVIDSSSYEFSHAFVSVGFLVIVAATVLGMTVITGTAKQAKAAYEAGDTAAGQAATDRIAMFGTLDTVLVLIAIIAMVYKWGV